MNKRLPNEVFWENVDRYRTMSMKKLSIMLGLGPTILQTGRNSHRLPNPERMMGIANILDVQYVDLFEDWSEGNG